MNVRKFLCVALVAALAWAETAQTSHAQIFGRGRGYYCSGWGYGGYGYGRGYGYYPGYYGSGWNVGVGSPYYNSGYYGSTYYNGTGYTGYYTTSPSYSP